VMTSFHRNSQLKKKRRKMSIHDHHSKKNTYFSILLPCTLVVASIIIVASCSPSDNQIVTVVTLPGGELLTVTSPVPVTIDTDLDPSSYPDDSKTSVARIEGTLGAGQTAEITFTGNNVFEEDDAIAFLNVNEVWFPVSSVLNADKKSITATVYHFSIWGVVQTTPEEPSSSYLLIDHTAVQDFDQIPDYWLEQAKGLTIHYGHRSHGMQIISGLKYIEENKDAVKYNVEYVLWENDPTIPPQEDPPAHRICNTDWQPEDYWETEEGRNETRRFAASGLYDFSMFGWCGELSTSADLADYITEYLSTLDMFEQEYPNMRFIYQTGFTDGYPSWSRLREHNDQIREYCINNNKVLYDFADIESWDPDGNYYPDDYSCSWCEEWCTDHSDECEGLPQECDSGLDTCCPHTHGYNCYIKGKAYWYMMARLAGWDGQSE
jgi:hypothetical protein